MKHQLCEEVSVKDTLLGLEILSTQAKGKSIYCTPSAE
jgi:hypothetical protein